MLRRPYLPAIVILVGVLLVIGPPVLFDTDTPEEFPVDVGDVNNPERYENLSYENLSEPGKRVFQRARENGSTTIKGAENVPPEFQEAVKHTDVATQPRVIEYDGERYLMQVHRSTGSIGTIIIPLLVMLYGISTTVTGFTFLGRFRSLWGDIMLMGYLTGGVAILTIGTINARLFFEDGWFELFSNLTLASVLGTAVLLVLRFGAYWYED